MDKQFFALQIEHLFKIHSVYYIISLFVLNIQARFMPMFSTVTIKYLAFLLARINATKSPQRAIVYIVNASNKLA